MTYGGRASQAPRERERELLQHLGVAAALQSVLADRAKAPADSARPALWLVPAASHSEAWKQLCTVVIG